MREGQDQSMFDRDLVWYPHETDQKNINPGSCFKIGLNVPYMGSCVLKVYGPDGEQASIQVNKARLHEWACEVVNMTEDEEDG